MAIKNPIWLMLALLLLGAVSLQGMGELGSYQAGSGLMGQVIDASGKGISGAKVWIIGSEGEFTNTTTNATGYYALNIPSGSYTIMAELPGYSFTSSPAEVQNDTMFIAQNITGYPVNMMPTAPAAPAAFSQYGLQYAPAATGWVQGRIADRSGAGIPYASIMVDGFPASETTDEQGNYRLALTPGLHRIDPRKSGYGIPPRVVRIYPGQTTNFNMIGIRTTTLGRGG